MQAYLVGAQIAYDNGEFSVSIEYSQQAITLADEMVVEAVNLTNQAGEHINIVRYTTIVSFIVSDLIVCIIGLYLINKI